MVEQNIFVFLLKCPLYNALIFYYDVSRQRALSACAMPPYVASAAVTIAAKYIFFI